MAEIERLILLYHNMYMICIVLAVVLFLLSIFLFFWLDIKNVLLTLTGRAERKAIKQMEEEAVFTSQLTRRAKNKYARGMVSPSGQLATPGGNRQHPIEPPKRQSDQPLIQLPSDNNYTEALEHTEAIEYIPKADTEVLSQDVGVTSVLANDTTTVLEPSMLPTSQEQVKVDVSVVNFILERQIMMIHTEESIG